MMCIIWLATSFGYYLLLTLTNTFSQVYVTSLISSMADIAGYILSGIFTERIGVELSLKASFISSTFGGILILAWGLQHQDSNWFLVCFLFTKFGISCAFNIIYIANSYFFPVLFAASALGYCNFLSRFFSSISFIISRMDEPLPMILFTVLCSIATIAAFLL